LILFARELAQKKSIGFDAVMAMAIHLQQPPLWEPIVSFEERLPEQRWTSQDAQKFVSLLKQFYKDTACENFFEAHKALYKTAENRFANVVKKVDLRWYASYYGKMPEAKFNLIVGLGNGGGNFGPKLIYPDGREELFAIVGTWTVDTAGTPVYGDEFLPMIIHEFNHSFVNQLIDAHAKELEKAGKKIFPQVSDQMAAMAYSNWKTMLYEALVRASVIQYSKAHLTDSVEVQDRINQERKNGFIWMPELVGLLDHYKTSIHQYPTLAAFMPEIVLFYNRLSKNEHIKDEFEKSRPEVISLEPFQNLVQDVDPAISQMTINFSKPMNPNHYSIRLADTNKEHMPISDLLGYTNGNKSLALKLTLKPDWEYSFILGEQKFESVNGYPLKEYTVKFKTRK
jgi:hypothetical protein